MGLSSSRDEPGVTVTELTAELEHQPTLSLLLIGDGSVETHPLPAAGTISIGRSERNDVRIDDVSISREHAVLHVGDTFEIEDLESANGTRVRGVELAKRSRTPIEPGQVIELGHASSMLVIQRTRGIRPKRRLWPHGYFEARLETECERSRASGSSFALLRIQIEGGVSKFVQEALTASMKASDVVASYAPGQYEVLLPDANRARANHVAARIRDETQGHDLVATIGVACFPVDGVTADALVAAAGVALRKMNVKGDAKEQIVIEAPAMRDLRAVLERVSRGTISVLLQGETGVGKEVFAHMVHSASPRKNGPFIAFNCAAVSEQLAESELFGHVKGAFTGADSDKEGLFEAARGGTVFLDEIGEMAPALQAKMLRAIQEKQITRVGSVVPSKIDVRFVAATNRDLESEIATGKFRRDLFYRLNGVSLMIPPLRERVVEIAKLADLFLEKVCREIGWTSSLEISERALDQLEKYHWPGNIRELGNVIERAVLLANGDRIEPEHLPLDKMVVSWAVAPEPAVVPVAQTSDAQWFSPTERQERERILDALERCNGNQSRAAEMLNIPRRTFTNRLEKYSIPRPRKK